MQRRDHGESPTGTGAGITGASGDLIDDTGGTSGIGGTGHDDEAQATGQHPDERSMPTQQDVMEQAEKEGEREGPGSTAAATEGQRPR